MGDNRYDFVIFKDFTLKYQVANAWKKKTIFKNIIMILYFFMSSIDCTDRFKLNKPKELKADITT